MTLGNTIIQTKPTVQPGKFNTESGGLVEVTEVDVSSPDVRIDIDGWYFNPQDLRDTAELFLNMADALEDMKNDKV